jgi:hypothetical protein
MNTFRKVILSTVATIGVVGPAVASPSILVALPDISVLTTEVGRWIAEEWQALEKVLLSVPRAARAERKAAVTIFEGPNHMIVTASRLPAEDETITLAARR